MRLSRTDLLPVLTIMAGGVLGASLSIGLLGRSPAVDVPPVVYENTTSLESALQRMEEAQQRMEEAHQRLERNLQERFEKEIEQVQTRYEEALGQKGGVDRVVTATDGVLGAGSAINIRGFSSIAIGNQPIIYVDGTRVEPPR